VRHFNTLGRFPSERSGYCARHDDKRAEGASIPRAFLSVEVNSDGRGPPGFGPYKGRGEDNVRSMVFALRPEPEILSDGFVVLMGLSMWLLWRLLGGETRAGDRVRTLT
jgi:hypothetical protein